MKKNLDEAVKGLKIADNMPIPKGDLMAKIDLPNVEIKKTTTPQGANETDKTHKLKRQPRGGIKGRAKAGQGSEGAIKKAKSRRSSGTPAVPSEIKRPEEKKEAPITTEWGFYSLNQKVKL
jgi:hypothetical protein